MPDQVCADCGGLGADSPYEGHWVHGHVEDCITALRARLAEVERDLAVLADAIIPACEHLDHSHRDRHRLGHECPVERRVRCVQVGPRRALADAGGERESR